MLWNYFANFCGVAVCVWLGLKVIDWIGGAADRKARRQYEDAERERGK